MLDLQSWRNRRLPEERSITKDWKGTSQPKVSILCNTFNHRQYLDDAIRGFLLQRTSFPFEVIIHDDASTDGTQEIIAHYCALYPRLIRSVIQKENQYRLGNKPTPIALEYARGVYIALCEGDDFWPDDDKLEYQCAILDEQPGYSACSGFAWILNGSRLCPDGGGPPSIVRQTDLLAGFKQHTRTCTLMMRRSFLPSRWPMETSKAYALDNFLRVMLAKSGPIRVLDRRFACYRIHAQGVWSPLRGDDLRMRKIHDLSLLLNLVENPGRKFVECRIALMSIRSRRYTAGARIRAGAALIARPKQAAYITGRTLIRYLAGLVKKSRIEQDDR